jgi:hypothetical protein
MDDIFKNNEDQAQMFLHECSSYLLMKGIQEPQKY